MFVNNIGSNGLKFSGKLSFNSKKEVDKQTFADVMNGQQGIYMKYAIPGGFDKTPKNEETDKFIVKYAIPESNKSVTQRIKDRFSPVAKYAIPGQF